MFVKHKSCDHPETDTNNPHQHVRRFIVPRDAYVIATVSQNEAQGEQGVADMTSPAVNGEASYRRPRTAAVRGNDVTSGIGGPGRPVVRSRIKSAPIKSSSRWKMYDQS